MNYVIAKDTRKLGMKIREKKTNINLQVQISIIAPGFTLKSLAVKKDLRRTRIKTKIHL